MAISDWSSTRSNGGFWILCVFLVLLQCYPVWSNQYFPSQDGPSHLYNAGVLARYHREPVYQEYFRLHPFRSCGNMVSQYVLALLLGFLPPHLAEKVLLTVYIVFLPLAFRYLLTAVSQHANVFSLFAFVFLPNYFLYMGFWNFCLSIPFLFLAFGYLLRAQRGWTGRSVIVFTLLSISIYAAHLVSWVVFALASVIVLLSNTWQHASIPHDRRLRAILKAVVQVFGPALPGLVIPALLTFVYIGSSRGNGAKWHYEPYASLRERVWPVYGFLSSMGSLDKTLVLAFIACAVSLAALAAARRIRQFSLRRTDHLLMLSGLLALLALVGPDAYGTGSFIPGRLWFCACLFLFVWLAAQAWGRLPSAACGLFACLFTIASVYSRAEAHRDWNCVLKEYVSAGRQVRPGASVLSLQLASAGSGVDPARHAAGLLPVEPFVNLRDYEAATDHFLISFQPQRSPFSALGTKKELEGAPPKFDIPRYEKLTDGRVDYVLFYGPTNARQRSPELEMYGSQLAVFRLCFVSQPTGMARLYERTAYPGQPGR